MNVMHKTCVQLKRKNLLRRTSKFNYTKSRIIFVETKIKKIFELIKLNNIKNFRTKTNMLSTQFIRKRFRI